MRLKEQPKTESDESAVREAIRHVDLQLMSTTLLESPFAFIEKERCETILSTLNKQLPVKLSKKWSSSRGKHQFHQYECGKCKRPIKAIDSAYNYCPYCGQKLDWGD